ncbi:MAG: 50S ribosomal protein L6 [Candidatus Paceibacterota bacterium]
MSRIGKKPIEVPENVTASMKDGVFTAEGPNGTLERKLHDIVSIEIDAGEITVTPKEKNVFARSMWGTAAAHIKNMITGVTEGFKKQLIFSGIGYRANVGGDTLTLEMGYSHNIELDIPDTLEVSVEKNTITVSGPDKELVGSFAADIRAVRTPEPYKGSGIKYADEIIRRKEGKKAV